MSTGNIADRRPRLRGLGHYRELLFSRDAAPVMISTRENVSDMGIASGLYPGPPARAGYLEEDRASVVS
jgi:hypothetical protein